jgi:hypothetical protein
VSVFFRLWRGWLGAAALTDLAGLVALPVAFLRPWAAFFFRLVTFFEATFEDATVAPGSATPAVVCGSSLAVA